MTYPLILLGLLVTTIVFGFIPSRRHQGAYFLAAAIGSIPGFIAGIALASVVESWLRNQGLNGLLIGTNSDLVAFALSNVPWGITGVSTLLFAGVGSYVVYLRREKAQTGKHPRCFRPRLR